MQDWLQLFYHSFLNRFALLFLVKKGLSLICERSLSLISSQYLWMTQWWSQCHCLCISGWFTFRYQALSRVCYGSKPIQSWKWSASRSIGHKFLKRIFSDGCQPQSTWSSCDEQGDSWRRVWTCKYVSASWYFVWLRNRNLLHFRLAAFSFLIISIFLLAWIRVRKS